MNNPLAVFQNLRDLYLRYLDSPFDLRYTDLVRERRTLLDRDGYLWRQPLIEPVPAYPACGRVFREVTRAIPWTPLGALQQRMNWRISWLAARFARTCNHTNTNAARSSSQLCMGVTWSLPRELVQDGGVPYCRCSLRSCANREHGARRALVTELGLVDHFTMTGDRRSWQPRISQRANEEIQPRAPLPFARC